MKKKKSVFLFLLFLSNLAFSQDTLFKIQGTVIDEKTKLPLSDVSIQISGSLRGTTTNSDGKFKLSTKENHLVLKFSIIGYEDKFINLNNKSNQQITISLTQQIQELKEVKINSSNFENIIKDKEYNVLDYDFNKENILLITYKNDLKKSKLLLLNSNFDTISQIRIPHEPKALFKDCLGNDHVICDDYSYQVFVNENKLELLDPQDLKKFESILYPCVAEDSLNYYIYRKHNDGKIISNDWHDFESNNHTIIYTSANKINKHKKDFAIIIDEISIKMREDEINFENAKATVNPRSKASDERVFFETSITKEVFAPLYKINNQIHIFDFINSFIKIYSSSGELIKKTPIDLHKGKNWKREMCVDEKTGRAFTLFESKGLSELKEINLKTGTTDISYNIPYTFIKNIKVYDNYIYFLDRDIRYSETRYLSRLKIN